MAANFPMGSRIQVLQHVAFEGPGRLRDWAARAGHTLDTTRLYMEERLPKVDELDVLVVMGGPMGANDDSRYRWMRGEKLFIELAIQKKKKVLGICLGAQLIANVLGARVYANPEKEIGFYPIELDPPNVRQTALNVLPQRANVFHWHGDTFDLPAGALHLARSRACENQAFAWNSHVIGLQFHLEMGHSEIETLVRQSGQDLKAGGFFVMSAEEILDLTPSQTPPLQAALFRFMDGFAG